MAQIPSIYIDLQIFRRAEELDHELDLPPYTHSTVLLDLDYYGAKTYNIMQTAIAVNAVDSERAGPVRNFIQWLPHISRSILLL